jgi:hypothetical protein
MRISDLTLKRIGQAKAIPRGYGLVYWDYCRAEGGSIADYF